MIRATEKESGDSMIDDSAPAGSAAPASGGTLVIRTWIEADGDPAFRARVTFSEGPGRHGSLAAADREQVVQAVREWLWDQNG